MHKWEIMSFSIVESIEEFLTNRLETLKSEVSCYRFDQVTGTYSVTVKR